jgi:tetratricopeptide (TPR) repeat protein
MTHKTKPIRIFISSPGDVAEERTLTKKVITRLQGIYSDRVILEPIFWEHEPLLATKSFQEQIVRPSETDIVITILWSRLGTRLPSSFSKEDGSHYESGTEYEFEDALRSYQKQGTPDLLIYRKTADPKVSLKDKDVLLEKIKQKESVDSFFNKWFHDKAEGTLIAAFHSFNDSADFEEILESHLDKLIKNRTPEYEAGEGKPSIKPQWTEGSPFRGLNVFNYEHSPIFFGRTKAVSEIIDALRIQAASDRAFLLVLGMSGGGKSSLVRAGVLPMITQPGVIEGVGLWRRAIMKPGDSLGDLFDGLAACLLRANALPELSADGTGIDELAKLLRETPRSVVPLIKGGLSQAASELAVKDQLKVQPKARLVLLVDQLEEIFSIERFTHEERKRFIDALDALAHSGRVWVIATLRSDFYPRTAELEGLINLKEGAGQYDLRVPTPAEIGQMIRQPAQIAGLHFEQEVDTNENLDDVLRDAAVQNPNALPLLEFTLEELYKQRTEEGLLTFSAYNELGGVEGALAKRAETVFSGLDTTVQDAMDTVMHALISISIDDQERISRKYAMLNSISSTPETKVFVEAFVNSRLFTTDLAADGEPVLNIAHEALLQHWPRLRDWIEKNKEDLRVHARISIAAGRWSKEQNSKEFLLSAGKQVSEAEQLLKNTSIELAEDENRFIRASIARRKRIWWLKRAVVAVIAILAIFASGTAYLAQQERDKAKTEAKTAEQVSDFLVGLFQVSDPGKTLGDTITAREILEKGSKRIKNELTDEPEVQATLMSVMAEVYVKLGLFDQAIGLIDTALKIRENLFGPNSLEASQSMDILAQVYQGMGNYHLAARLFKESLDIRIQVLGYNDNGVTSALNNLASIYSYLNKYDSAIILYRQALEIEENLHGLERIEIAIGLLNLGDLLNDQGKIEEAEKCIRKGIEIAKRVEGESSYIVGTGQRELGELLRNKGMYEDAEKAFIIALDINRNVYGEEHNHYIVTLNGYSGLLSDMGHYSKSDSVLRLMIEIYRKMLGDSHPNFAVILHNYGLGLLNQGKLQEAEPVLFESMEISSKYFPPDDWRVVLHWRSIGLCYYYQEKYIEAEPLILNSFEVFKEVFGIEHPRTQKSLEFTIGLYKAWDKPDKVAEWEALLHDIVTAPEPI